MLSGFALEILPSKYTRENWVQGKDGSVDNTTALGYFPYNLEKLS